MGIIDKIYEARSDYSNDRGNKVPQSIGISYDDGVILLEDFLNTLCVNMPTSEIEQLLIERDQEKVKKFLNSMTVFGMKLTVTDLTI